MECWENDVQNKVTYPLSLPLSQLQSAKLQWSKEAVIGTKCLPCINVMCVHLVAYTTQAQQKMLQRFYLTFEQKLSPMFFESLK